jgi:hypothetical protein
MNLGCRALSSNTRRNSEIERVRTSSVTNVPAQTVLRIVSLDTGSPPGREARHTKTSITLGSRRIEAPFKEMVFRLGWTNQVPRRKSPFNSRPQGQPL